MPNLHSTNKEGTFLGSEDILGGLPKFNGLFEKELGFIIEVKGKLEVGVWV